MGTLTAGEFEARPTAVFEARPTVVFEARPTALFELGLEQCLDISYGSVGSILSYKPLKYKKTSHQ